MEDVIVYALPLFGVLMGVEFLYGLLRGRNNYGFSDTLSSLSQGLLSQVVAVCTQVVQVGLYAMAYPFIALAPDAAIWHHWSGIPLAVLLYDFCDYWLHRVSHESAIFWAAHVVHHQSEHFNLSTALRQESAYGLSGWMFFLPMAVAGVPPADFAIAGLVVLLYQFWIHTEHVGRLGALDRVLSTPSNHRVHHAVNDRYIDRNFGAILVVWDRLFGTFEPESEPCVYGTRVPLRSWNPMTAVGRTYGELFAQCRRTRGAWNKVQVLFRAPGWEAPLADGDDAPRPARAVVATAPTGALSRARQSIAVALFVLATAATAGFLWRSDDLGRGATVGAALGVVATLWAIGAVLEERRALAAVASFGVLAGAGVLALVALA
jgi:alkylglycerol monooxygenase